MAGEGHVSPGEMCWQAESWRDMDRVRAQLREDLGLSRRRRLPATVRVGAWVALVAGSAAMGEPAAAIPAVILFEGFVAPRLGRRPAPTIGPLRTWHPPPSFRESPEAPAPWALRGR
jgi:hypothetical protein